MCKPYGNDLCAKCGDCETDCDTPTVDPYECPECGELADTLYYRGYVTDLDVHRILGCNNCIQEVKVQ
jgi:hypothetical protein